MIKKIIILLMTAVLMCGTVSAVWAASPASGSAGSGAAGDDSRSSASDIRVYDGADLLSYEEEMQLESRIDVLRKETKMDFVVVTTNQTGGRDSREYADDVYDTGGYGTGKERSGALFLIDMYNRELNISTSGAMIRFLTDSRIDDILDDAYEYASGGDFYGAAEITLTDMEKYYKKGIPGGQYNYDAETGEISRHRSIRWYEFLLALAAAAFTGGTAVLSVRKEYAMKEQMHSAAGFHQAYRADASLNFRASNDALVNSFVTQQIIPRTTTNVSPGDRGGGFSGGGRSTTHHSGGGGMHGGGGRRF